MLLEKLAEKNDFKQYKTFLDNVELSYKSCILCYIKEVYEKVIDTKKEDGSVKDKKQEDLLKTKKKVDLSHTNK